MADQDRMSKIVGKGNVLDDPEILEAYSRDLSFVPSVKPSCVVKPGNAEEVQQVVKYANETLTPLVPISSGPPHFRGDTVPRVGGAAIVDLSRMKKIMRVDARNRVAMVEPGVTFAELQPALEKEGLSAYMPLSPRSSKSVIGSMLEREPITMPAHHWDCTDPMLCAEIIFGTGDKLRSGEAAGPDTIEEQWKIGKAQMTPFGLSQMDENKLISGAQGTIGVITWATLKCRFSSQLNRTFLVPSESLAPLIDLSYQLMRIRLADHCFIVNDLNLACLIGQDAEEIKGLRDSFPRWVLVVSFEGYGELPEAKVQYQEGDFRQMVVGCGQLKAMEAIAGVDAEAVAALLSRASGEPYWKLRYKGGCHDVFFLTMLEKTPAFINTLYASCQSCKYSAEDVGVYLQMMVQGTSCHCEFDLYYDPANPIEAERTERLVREGSQEMANGGAFFSRPYGAWAKIAYSRAAETIMVQRKVKDIFDPNNILNPGKLCF